MKFVYWKSYPLGSKGGWSWDCFIPCHQLVGRIFHITMIRWISYILFGSIVSISSTLCILTVIYRGYAQILPLLRKYKVLHLNRTDTRLANNDQPLEIQKLRCRVNFSALKFTPQIEELGRKVINLLQKNGPFMVLHLRYEMDMLAFSGCTQGCNKEEVEELTRMR